MNNLYFFMRHGESKANIKRKVISFPKNGVLQYGLTPLGKKQTLLSISKSKELDKNTIIYSSDFKRARETAEIAYKYLNLKKPTLRKELRERNLGNYEKGKDNIYSLLWKKDLQGKTLESVESVVDVSKRIINLISFLEKKHKNKIILLVTHGDIISIGLSVLQKKNLKEHHKNFSLVKNAEIIKVRNTE